MRSPGALANPQTVLAMFGTPLVATGALVLAIPAAPRALNAIPLPLLVGLNVIRLGGVLFVLLALAGRLSGPFPHISGWGDFVTGALANPVAWLALRETRIGDRLLNGTSRSRPRWPAPLVEPGAVFAHLLALRRRRVALAG